MSRDPLVEAIADHAAGAYDDTEHDLENAEEWEPVEGMYPIATTTPSRLQVSAATENAEIRLTGGNFTNRQITTRYTAAGVKLDIEANADGEPPRGGTIVGLNPQAARDLALSLYMAAEELDRRTTAEDTEPAAPTPTPDGGKTPEGGQ